MISAVKTLRIGDPGVVTVAITVSAIGKLYTQNIMTIKKLLF